MKKKTMIRRIALILLVLAFGMLSACGGDKEENGKEKKPSKKTEQSADEDSSENKTGKKKKKKSSEKQSGDPENGKDENSSENKAEQMLKKKGSGKAADEIAEEETAHTPGESFAGDWEGMTILADSKGTTKGKGGVGISDDYIIGTYARIKTDDDGNIQMDMVGITIPQLNYSIDSAVYDPDSDTLAVSGKLGGGTFDTTIQAPGENGVLTLSGRTNGDIKSNYVVYLKRLDSEWDRSDAPQIADKEYNIYIVNNLPNLKGKTLEERVEAYRETGMDVDMSGFLK